MKNRLIVIARPAVVCLAAFVMSCGPISQFFRSMVSDYGVPESIRAFPLNRWTIGVEMSVSEEYGETSNSNPSFYDYWCNKHGDMSFNREVETSRSYPIYPYRFAAADYVTIEITSDADWNDAYPAGASLNDMTMFYSMSPIKYIRSGYVEEFNWDNIDKPAFYDTHFKSSGYPSGGPVARGTNPFHPVMKRVSQLTPDDMVLLGSGDIGHLGCPVFFLEFMTMPTAEKEHTITVTLTTDEGEIFSDTVQMTFN